MLDVLTGLPIGLYILAFNFLFMGVAWAVCWSLAVLLRPDAEVRRFFLSWATVFLAGSVPAAAIWYGVLQMPQPWLWFPVGMTVPMLPVVYGLTRRARLAGTLGQWRWCSIPAVAVVLGLLVAAAYYLLRDKLPFGVWFAMRDALLIYSLTGPLVALGAVLVAEVKGE